jgi:hypothetical protein
MKGNFELNLSILVSVFLVVVYVIYEVLSTPTGGHPFGHALGILGALLMLMTEFLYSARKRRQFFRFGQVRHWLSFHIFTGIVGPALVLMHTGFAFRGLAGLTMLLTAIVVASGFLGRYIYTAVPRTLAGIEVDRRTLESQAAKQRAELEIWARGKSERVQSLLQQEAILPVGKEDLTPLQLLTRRFREWRHRQRQQNTIDKLEKEEQVKVAEVERLISRQQRLVRQIRSLQTVRRMMGWWHAAHVPLGLTLFSAMAIHIVAAIYYSGI